MLVYLIQFECYTCAISVTRSLKPKSADQKSKGAKKGASLKCQFFYCIFGRFRVGLVFGEKNEITTIFSTTLAIFIQILTFLLHKSQSFLKAPLFCTFGASANFKILRAKGTPKSASLARKRHICSHRACQIL